MMHKQVHDLMLRQKQQKKITPAARLFILSCKLLSTTRQGHKVREKHKQAEKKF